jgi:hypothetical protein
MKVGDLVCQFEITAELLISLGFSPVNGGFMLNGVFVWQAAGSWRAQISGLNRVLRSRGDFLALVQLTETELV